MPKAPRAFDHRGVREHAPPENFEVLDSRRCIFRSFFVALFLHFFAPKSELCYNEVVIIKTYFAKFLGKNSKLR